MDQYKALELSPSNNMKKSLIATALSLILYIPAHANEPPKTPKNESRQEGLKKVNQETSNNLYEKQLEEYLKKDKESYTLADPIVMKMSREDKKRYYFAKADEISGLEDPNQKKRFYLLDLEPEFDKFEFEKRMNAILDLAQKTINLIKELEPVPNRKDPSYSPNFPFPNEPTFYTFRNFSIISPAKDIINKEDYEWAHNLFDPELISSEPLSLIAIYLRKGNEDYNLSDFEYKEMDTPEFKKRRLVEKNYEQLYLHIKAAGLIRKVSSAFYPKSFLREYADHTGLTKFIVGAEEKAGKKLKHDELAEQFFGSYDEWMTGFEKFLQNKLVILKIGE